MREEAHGSGVVNSQGVQWDVIELGENGSVIPRPKGKPR